MIVDKKKIISFIATTILSIVLINFGIAIIKKFPEDMYIGIVSVIIGFVLFYFSIYAPQIQKNELDIKDLEKRIQKLEEDYILDKKLLNTLKDMIILNKIRKIK